MSPQIKFDPINLYGRVIITGNIRTLTGLHIGKGREGVTIGGVDNPVVRDVLTNTPYIPGSSLKGKLRSLAEKSDPTRQPNTPIGGGVRIHTCDARNCPICRLYGISGHQRATAPTRLTVRDTFLSEASRDRLKLADTDLPFTEVKYENSIDRVTSIAHPRPFERVPADSIFGPFEMIITLYENNDHELFKPLFKTMQLLEDDSLGGSGSRGSGKIRFESLKVVIKPVAEYGKPLPNLIIKDAGDLSALLSQIDIIVGEVKKLVNAGG